MLIRRFVSAAALLGLSLSLATTPTFAHKDQPAPAFALLGSYATGLAVVADEVTAAETVAYAAGKMYVTNASDNSLDIVSVKNPAAPALIERIDLSPYGAGPNSVASSGDLVAVAVEADPKTDPGSVVFFSLSGKFLSQVTVGALPDMLTFTPNGRLLLVANEGEPNDDWSIDPEGSVSIVRIDSRPWRISDRDVKTLNFAAFQGQLDPAVRIYGPGSDAADGVQKNIEPEYITVSDDSRTAYVTLQENNALATVDLRRMRITAVSPLGLKDHSLPGNGLDASDRDSAINIANWPVFGLYEPDAIASYRTKGKTYLVTANEGDTRDYDAFGEESRLSAGSYVLDPTAFPNAAALKANAALGRLTVTTAGGDTDGDGDFDQIHVPGGRSFSIWNDKGQLVWDSGDQLEKIVAEMYPADFNSNNDENGSFDSRSDNKGPEPEGVAVGEIDGRTYAFVGLERMGGVMVFDISSPSAPSFVQYLNNRDFSADVVGPDSGPEVLKFVSAKESPTRKPLILVANEISGTVSIYTIAGK